VELESLPGYGTFSGTDMVISMVFPGCKPITLGQATTVSYSVLRDKNEVRTIGRITAKGFTKGGRRVAGQIIFTVFNRHIIEDIKEQIDYLKDIPRILMDELPPFDLIITLANEYGSSAFLVIYGITTLHEGKVFSVEDMMTENTFQYLARDIKPLGAGFGGVNFVARTEFRAMDEMLAKFKVENLAPEIAAAEWERKAAEMQAIIDAQISQIPPASSSTTTVSPVQSQTSESSGYKIGSVKLKVFVRDEDSHPLNLAKVRIWVAKKNRAFPSEPNFYTCGDDHMVEFDLEDMPIYDTPGGNHADDLVRIRAVCDGYSDDVQTIYLSDELENGVADKTMVLKYSTGSFTMIRIRPEQAVIEEDMNYREIFAARLFSNGYKLSDEPVTWMWWVDCIENTINPNSIKELHQKGDTTGSDGVTTFDAINEIKKLYPQFDLVNGVQIRLSCVANRGGTIPCAWIIKSR